MDTLQNFFIYSLITILMSPLLVVYGIPFILMAKGFDHFARRRLKDSTRLVLSCGIASLGMAPAYDMYRAPLPIYTWLWDGRSPGFGFMLFSFLMTWLVVIVLVRQLQRFSLRKGKAA